MSASLSSSFHDAGLASEPHGHLPRLGDVIEGKFTITRLIGEGGMGVVYEAFHQRLGYPVALKFLHPEAAQTPGAMARFQREAHAAAELSGVHVARVLDVDALPNGLPYMVMELLKGRDLEAELRSRGALPVAEAVDIVLQACTAMTEAHAHGIIHRDLQPANIFLVEPTTSEVSLVGARFPVVKVLDFGVSLFSESRNMARVTATTMSIGTPLYMSPEQVRCSKRVDARTDIWSLGVVLYEALAGEPPFDGTSTAAVAAIVADETPSVRAMRPDVPIGLDVVIARSLAKDVSQRFQTVEDFARALAPFGSGRVRRRSHASFDEVARTWLVWPPIRKSLASASAAASAVRSGRPGALSRRARIVAAVGTCLVVLPAITFAGFSRDDAQHAAAPPRCVETTRLAGAAPTPADPATDSATSVVSFEEQTPRGTAPKNDARERPWPKPVWLSTRTMA